GERDDGPRGTRTRSGRRAGTLSEAGHDLAGEELHGATHSVLRQPPEIHPAHELAHPHLAHLLAVAGGRAGRSAPLWRAPAPAEPNASVSATRPSHVTFDSRSAIARKPGWSVGWLSS